MQDDYLNIWYEIEKKISIRSETDFRITKRASVSGGDINQSFCIESESRKYFVKINDEQFHEMFVSEIESSKILRNVSVFVVPEFICSGICEGSCYLVLEYLAISPQGEQKKFAKKLAEMHSKLSGKFGFPSNNFIGLSHQINTESNNWGKFFCKNRLSYQVELLRRNNGHLKNKELVSELLERVPHFLNEHNPVPSLVHGDLWQGNYGFDDNGMPVLFDPACYYADHEVDLAMLELFGNPRPAFFESYKQYREIKPGYELRKKVYNLYHILNHANLFGGGYIQQSMDVMKDLLRRI